MANAEKLGERKIIEIIQNSLDPMPKMPVPFGDDVAACEIGSGKLAVLKTDMLVDKTDVPKGMSLQQAARKAVVMNVSDFAAKGVKPIALLVSLGLPRHLTRMDIKEIGSGLNIAAREYGAYILGGDTGETSDLVITLFLFGTAEDGKLMLRSGAKLGDFLAVTGLFGNPSAGLKILLDNFKTSEQLKKVLVESALMPNARLKEGVALSRTGAVDAAIDSSDGLAWSLHEIGKASKVGIRVDMLPIAKETERFAKDNRLDPEELVLYGGEEYELVLCIKPRLWNEAEKAVKNVGGQLIRIGKVTAGREILLKTHGKLQRIETRGYEHFKR